METTSCIGARERPADRPARHCLQVGAFEPRSLVNGPGVRAVVWVQGCGRRCPGCFNPEFLPFEGGHAVPVQEVIQWIADSAAAGNPAPDARAGLPAPPRQAGDPAYMGANAAYDLQPLPALEGVTFSGGEPFDQAVALAVVARAAREMGLSVFIFTGYPWQELQRSVDPGHRALLEVSDLLVAGPYDRNLPCKHPLLASANQELVFLTDRYRHFDFGQKRKVEFRIGPDGDVRVSGFPMD